MKLKNTEIIYSLKVWLTSTAIPPFIFLIFAIFNKTEIYFTEVIFGVLFTISVGLIISLPYLPIFYFIVNQIKKLFKNLLLCKLMICFIHSFIILTLFYITWENLFSKDKILISVYLISGGFSTLIWKLERTNLPILSFKRIAEFLNDIVK